MVVRARGVTGSQGFESMSGTSSHASAGSFPQAVVSLEGE
jgi:hypothetical protein